MNRLITLSIKPILVRRSDGWMCASYEAQAFGAMSPQHAYALWRSKLPRWDRAWHPRCPAGLWWKIMWWRLCNS